MKLIRKPSRLLTSVCEPLPIADLQMAMRLGATPIEDPGLDDLKDLSMELMLQCHTHKGIGLAANQLGVLKRVIYIGTEYFTSIIVNPTLHKKSQQMVKDEEMCLSCPGLKVRVDRHKRVMLKGWDQNLNPVSQKLTGLAARVAQHEIDHLNGITLRQRVRKY